MDIRTVAVSPEMAERWLQHNEGNRSIDRATVKRYANDMIRGQWAETGETIKFSSDGRLLDGQHRLSAVVMSRTTVNMLIARGVDPSAIHAIDTGRTRSAGDALTIMASTTNANAVAALARKIIGFEYGQKKVFNTTKIRGGSDSPITNRDIITYCARYDLSSHVEFAARIKYHQVAKVFGAGQWAFLHWMLSKTDQAAATEFLTKLATLDGVTINSPIRSLYDKLVRSSAKLDGAQQIHATILAWNAWRRNEPMLTIRVGRLEGAYPQAL